MVCCKAIRWEQPAVVRDEIRKGGGGGGIHHQTAVCVKQRLVRPLALQQFDSIAAYLIKQEIAMSQGFVANHSRPPTVAYRPELVAISAQNELYLFL